MEKNSLTCLDQNRSVDVAEVEVVVVWVMVMAYVGGCGSYVTMEEQTAKALVSHTRLPVVGGCDLMTS